MNINKKSNSLGMLCMSGSRESATEPSPGLLLLVLQPLRQTVGSLRRIIDPLQHLPRQQLKRLPDILRTQRRDLREVQLVLLGQVVALLKGDPPLVQLVGFIADDQSIDALRGVPTWQLGYLSISCSQKRSPSKDYRSVTS